MTWSAAATFPCCVSDWTIHSFQHILELHWIDLASATASPRGMQCTECSVQYHIRTPTHVSNLQPGEEISQTIRTPTKVLNLQWKEQTWLEGMTNFLHWKLVASHGCLPGFELSRVISLMLNSRLTAVRNLHKNISQNAVEHDFSLQINVYRNEKKEIIFQDLQLVVGTTGTASPLSACKQTQYAWCWVKFPRFWEPILVLCAALCKGNLSPTHVSCFLGEVKQHSSFSFSIDTSWAFSIIFLFSTQSCCFYCSVSRQSIRTACGLWTDEKSRTKLSHQ